MTPHPPGICPRVQLFQTCAAGGREAGTCLASFAQLRREQKGGLSALAFSPDGGTLFSGASDGSVAAWRMLGRQEGEDGGLRRGFL